MALHTTHYCHMCDRPRTLLVRDIVWRAGFAVVRCPDCALVFTIQWPNLAGTHPQLSDRFTEPAAGSEEEYWDEAGVAIELGLLRFHEAESDRYLDILARFRSAGRLLDVGCSFGAFLARARQRGYDVCGLEASPGAARVGQREFGLSIIPRALDAAGLEAGAFDIVTLLDVIEHQLDPRALVREAARVLRPGGVLLIETPNENSVYRAMYRAYNTANNLMRRLSGGRWDRPWGGYYSFDARHRWQEGHVVHFNLQTLERLVAPVGFRLLHAEHQYTDVRYLLARQRDTAIGRRIILRSAHAVARALSSPNKIVALFEKCASAPGQPAIE